MLGYLLITSFIPFIIIKTLRKLTNKNWSIIIFWCFMIIPIFESFGFFQFYYSKLSILGFGESLSYMFLYLSFFLLLPERNKKFYTIKYKNFFIIGLLCFGVVMLRPNYFLQFISFFLFLGIYTFYNQRENKDKLIKFFLIIIGFSPIFLISLHNWYFGEKFILLTAASTIEENPRVSPKIWINAMYDLLFFKLNYDNWNIILKNLKTWINYYEIWLIIIYLNLWVGLFRKNNYFLFRIICLSLIISHITYLFYAGDHRYTYGLWSMCLLIFFRDFRYFYSKKIFVKNFKKLEFNKDFSKSFYNFLDPLKN